MSTPGTRKEAGQEEIGAHESFVQMRELSRNIVKIRVFFDSHRSIIPQKNCR